MIYRRMIVPPTEWPKGDRCSACGRVVQWGDVALAGRSPSAGTVAFHKECIIGLVSKEFPESRYDKIKSSIEENGMFGIKVEGIV